jgi:hypothetical protein
MNKLLSLILFLLPLIIFAQKENLSDVWPAKWIMSDGPAKEYSVHHFRKTFNLDTVPETFLVNTSGDNRYKLFVNGEMVTWGPLRGDLRHWYYETTDIASYLKEGKNVIAAIVLNYGSHPPDAQLTVQTGFILAADNKENRFLNTPKGWKAKYNSAYSPSLVDGSQVNGYYGGGSKEIIDGNLFLWDWEKSNYDDSNWEDAIVIERAYAKTCKWASRWKLTPRDLPHEKLSPIRFEAVRKSNIDIDKDFPKEVKKVEIPANTKAELILDMGHQTTAYPVINLSRGKNASLKLVYVEAPYIDIKTKEKGNRNEIDDKVFIGFSDTFISDGEDSREYTTMWWRAFRYVKLEIETQDEALVLNDISAVYSTYPFEVNAKFEVQGSQDEVGNELIQNILELGDRTMKACSHEHFMDCPYYEESQFQGDARVEMLVSYYTYGDPSLAKQGIELFSWSLNDEGFLSARYPTNSYYYIPNFSIYWIGMLYDYMMLYDDHAYIASKLHISRYLLDYFERNEKEDGTLKRLDYHQFVDWSHKAGEPPIDSYGSSSIVDLHYLLALQWAIALEENLSEDKMYLNKYKEKEEKLRAVIRDKYWDEDLALFTDLPGDKTKLSQHANCLAILTNVTKGNEAKDVMKKVLSNENMVKATLYWSFYVFEALDKVGMGEEYLNNLGVWKEVLALGVTTWPETGPNSRSECHAWGSSPNYHFLKIVAGIKPFSPGFKEVLIEPSFGDIEEINAVLPHYLGSISVDLKKGKKGVTGKIILPEGITGIYKMDGKEIDLVPGENEISQ